MGCRRKRIAPAGPDRLEVSYGSHRALAFHHLSLESRSVSTLSLWSTHTHRRSYGRGEQAAETCSSPVGRPRSKRDSHLGSLRELVCLHFMSVHRRPTSRFHPLSGATLKQPDQWSTSMVGEQADVDARNGGSTQVQSTTFMVNRHEFSVRVPPLRESTSACSPTIEVLH